MGGSVTSRSAEVARARTRAWTDYVTTFSGAVTGAAYADSQEEFVARSARIPGVFGKLEEIELNIFRGHNEEKKYRSPLTAVGVDARASLRDLSRRPQGWGDQAEGCVHGRFEHRTHPKDPRSDPAVASLLARAHDRRGTPANR